MAITAAQVNELRQRTGLGMMECKKALQENDGDVEKAIEYFRKKGVKTSVAIKLMFPAIWTMSELPSRLESIMLPVPRAWTCELSLSA